MNMYQGQGICVGGPLTLATSGQDLGAIQVDLQVGHIVLRGYQLAEIIPGLQETLPLMLGFAPYHQTHSVRMTNLQDGKPCLTVRLAPFLALWVPELGRDQAEPGHAQVRGVQDIASHTVHVDAAVAKPEDLENREFAANNHLAKVQSNGTRDILPQKHSDELSAAFLKTSVRTVLLSRPHWGGKKGVRSEGKDARLMGSIPRMRLPVRRRQNPMSGQACTRSKSACWSEG